MKTEALVTPEVLQWARKRANLRVDEAAKKIGVSEEAVQSWETGLQRPTINQARTVARVYRRPLAVFYLEEPPKDFDVVRDFRRLGGIASTGVYPYELNLLIRELQTRQIWLREMFAELRISKLSFVASATLEDQPENLAGKIRAQINLGLDEQVNSGDLNAALNLWVSKVEETRVFVSQTSSRGRIDVGDARGFALADHLAPFIFLNAKDSLGGRIFTIGHELAHIWLGESGVSGSDLYGDNASDSGRVERFCNRVASFVVFPSSAFDTVFSKNVTTTDVESLIQVASRKFKISREVVARRLLDKKLITDSAYNRLHDHYVREWKREQEGRTGGGSYYTNQLRSLGKSFVRIVGDAYARGRIGGSDAADLLDAKIDRIPRLVGLAHARAIAS